LNNNVFIGSAFGPTLPANWKWSVWQTSMVTAGPITCFSTLPATKRQSGICRERPASSAFGPSLPNGWDLVVGDFNADDKPDYVLYSPATANSDLVSK
jgi:hypothetical protein